MADALLNGDGDDIFVYTGGRAPRDVRRAKIDESIDTIPTIAFADCRQLIEVEGHDKLKKIIAGAFLRCRSLRRLSNMTGVKEIEGDAFLGCHALSDVDFGKLEIIGNGAFCFCKSLRSINLPSVRRVGAGAFQGCEQLSGAVFGEGMEGIIRSSVFYECFSLRRIVVPLKDGLVIENNAFHNCANLSRVDAVGEIHKTISSLHMKSWRDEMREEIESINQTLPDTPSGWEKTAAIEQWIRAVFRDIEHYKTEHQIILKEAMTLLELALWKANLEENGVDLEGVRVTRGRRQVKRARKERCITSGAGIIIKNVLPFLELDE
jgi:hypothetical protein